MNDETEKEVFRRASDAKAHLNRLDKLVSSESAEHHIKEIRKNLEMIERRSDPAA